MTKEIDAIVEAIEKAGGSVRASVLIKQMENSGLHRRIVQRAIQSAFEKGRVRLGEKMVLEVASSGVSNRQAA